MEQCDYSCILCPLPVELSAEIWAWGIQNIPDSDLIDDGRRKDLHISVKYGLHKYDPYEMEKTIWEFKKIVGVTLGKTSLFSTPERDVVKVDVLSERLHALNRLLANTFNHTEEHPRYNPHVTLAYMKPGLGKKYVGLEDFVGKKLDLDIAKFSGNYYRETILPFES